MKQIVECVPNFSEGRNPETIDAIARAIRETKGCTLLDVDPGASTHRTVVTFVGDPEAVVQGALAAAKTAADLIDMSEHQGEHPRFGAMDVCPFIPVAGVSMADCVEIAKDCGRRLADMLGVPVYLYEAAASHDHRCKLPDVRQGEYEGLAQKLKDPDWQPDFGPAEFVPKWGATAVGARNFLIAYNVNILGTTNQAHRIALNLREAGRGGDQPGRLKEVKGMGWYVDEYNLAQVTVNLTDYKVTPIHVMFEESRKEAAALNVGVAGSEIVGLVPLESLLMAAEHYIEKENLFVLDEDQKIRLAVERLGLNSVTPFKPEERIIEYITAEPPVEPLAGSTLRGFIEAVAARTSAPGGGSVSACLAAMGAGLGAMAAKLTFGFRKFEDLDTKMRATIAPLHTLTRELIPMIDADADAYKDFQKALRLPQNTEAEKTYRKAQMQEGLKTAIRIPLQTMQLGNRAWEAMVEAARYGNIACLSDVQVGARALETGIWGAYQNVRINMQDISDETFRTDILKEAEGLIENSRSRCAQVLDILEKRRDGSE